MICAAIETRRRAEGPALPLVQVDAQDREEEAFDYLYGIGYAAAEAGYTAPIIHGLAPNRREAYDIGHRDACEDGRFGVWQVVAL